jgi:hypothetical protein
MRGVMGVVGWAALLALVPATARASDPPPRSYPGSAGCTTTLQACIDAAASGETIQIDTDDRIDEHIDIAKSLTLTRAPNRNPVIGAVAEDPRSITIRDPDPEGDPEALGPVNVTLSHLELDNAVLTITLSPAGSGHHVLVENCMISHHQQLDGSRGVDIGVNAPATVIFKNNTVATTGTPLSIAMDLMSGTASVTALGNTLTASLEEYSASGVALEFLGNGTGVVNVDLYSNLIYGVGLCSGCCGCSAAGITVGVSGRANANIDIINNTVDDLKGAASGIQVRTPDTRSHVSLNIFNNIISRAQGSAVQMPDQSDQLVLANDYNAFHENGEEDWGGYSGGPHTIHLVDSPFVNVLANDYHLLATTPLVGGGWNDPPGGLPTHDADGDPRVAGGTVDIGAFESDHSTVTTSTAVTSTTSTTSTITTTTLVTTTTAVPTTTLVPTTTVAPTTSTSTTVVTTTVSTIPGATTTTSVTLPTSTTATTTPVTSTTSLPPVVTTTMTLPPVVTTTTTPLPSCRDEVTYAAIVCRMNALESQVRGAQAGQLTTKLLGALSRAQGKAQEAERLTTGGQAGKAKMSVRAAIRALAKMQVRFRSRAGKRIPEPLRTRMIDAAGRIGRDLRSLL